MATPRIVVAGCGFGGVEAALNLKRLLSGKARITAIDSSDRFCFHASLPELVSGRAAVQEITIPYHVLFSRHGIAFRRARITRFDWGNRQVFAGKQSFSYDYLVVALGAEPSYYGIAGAREHAIPFTTPSDALDIRRRIALLCGRRARPGGGRGEETIAIVGGGLSGVELACEAKDLVDSLLLKYDLPPDAVRILLLERESRLHPGFSMKVSEFTEEYVKSKGISLRLNCAVKGIGKGGLVLERGGPIKAALIVWCAGIKPPAILSGLPKEALDGRCGLVLDPFLQSIADPRVSAVGDCAFCQPLEASPVRTAMRAMEQAEYVSRNIACEIVGKPDEKWAYDSRRFPALISLGRGMAVLSYKGYWAKGRLMSWAKKSVERMYLLRYRHGLEFLSLVEELTFLALEFLSFVRLRKLKG